ncbi:MAG: type VI secretion system protein TssA [Methylococcaceae bacterium]|jgi:type VI secretion system protein ImpA
MLDLEQLLSEISQQLPCGPNMEYHAERLALDVAIKGTPENQFSGQKSEPPNWQEINNPIVSLLNQSKDLQVILYLIRTHINIAGFLGLRDGLVLLNKSLNKYWLTIHPLPDPDDGDITQRINILEELCSQELILNAIMVCPLTTSLTVGVISYKNILYATEKLALPADMAKQDISFIKAVFNDAEQTELLMVYQAIQESEVALQQIENTVAEYSGELGHSVNLDPIKLLMKEIRLGLEQLAGEKLVVRGEAEAVSITQDLTQAVKTEEKPQLGLSKLGTRTEVIKAIDLICNYYQEYEPSSPVPLLLNRARKLVTADFMEIMQNLAPEAVAQINSIKGPEADSK